MDTIEAIRSRRAIRGFDPDFVMPEEELAALIELAMMSPTSFNIQHWKFVCVTDPALRSQIRAAAWDQAQVCDSAVLVVICADVKAWQKDMPRKWQNAPEEVAQMMVATAKQFYEGNEQLQQDEAIRSASLASQTLMLAATAMGYASGPMVGFDFDKVAELINLPQDHIISNFVVIGKGKQEAFPRAGQLPRHQVMVRDRFSQ